jgi:hypothetical protein
MPTYSDTRERLSRTAIRDLDIEITFFEGVIRRDPEFVEALQALGDDYTRRGRCLDGLEIDIRVCALLPEDALAHYNLACSFSLTDRLTEAADTVARSLDLGYKDVKWLEYDPDLENLRTSDAYSAVSERIARLKQTRTETS